MQKKTPSGYKILSTSFCPRAPVRLTWIAQLLFQSSYLVPNMNFRAGNLANSQSIARQTNRIHTMNLHTLFIMHFLHCFIKTWCNLTASGYIAVWSMKDWYKTFTRGKLKIFAVFCTQPLDWTVSLCNLSKGPSLLQLFLRWQSLQVLASKGEFSPAPAWGKLR